MEQHTKDIKRYSHSRLTTFKTCPRKHHYIYVEQLPTPDNEYTLSGQLFHKCLELVLKGEDCQPVFEEYADFCRRGMIKQEPDTLEYVVNAYFAYYYKEYSQELTIAAEDDLQMQLMDDDYMVFKVDQVLEDKGFFGIRDYKSTTGPLKYTHDMVKLNSQLLLYIVPVEEKYNRQVDFIEIDEVRVAKLQDVPFKNNGKPSADKKMLSLVTYADYYDALCEQGLQDNKEYQPILEYLRDRGHPLFKRIRVQISDRHIIDTNKQDMLEAYQMAQLDPKYRVVGKQCDMCPYKYLCEQDCYEVNQMLREKIIENI